MDDNNCLAADPRKWVKEDPRLVSDEFLEHSDEYRGFVEDGKQRINEALYALVPPWMTMGEFDDLTCDVFEKVRDAWEAGRERKHAQ